jgi:small-conductance mechanosensitive channel
MADMLATLYSLLPTALAVLAVLAAGYVLGNLAEFAANRIAEQLGIKRHVRFGLERELRRFGFSAGLIELLGKLLKFFIFIAALLYAADLTGFVYARDLFAAALVYSPNVIAAVLIVLFGTIVAELVSDFTIFRLQEYGLDALASKAGVKARPSKMLALLLKYFLYLVIAITSLAQLGLQVTSLVVLLAILWLVATLTLALIAFFGVKDLVPNIMAGAYLRATGQVRDGERLKAGGIEGEVLGVGFILTRVKSKSGTHFIPNSAVVREGFSVSGA